MTGMAQREVRQQVYDHRLRDLVRQTGDIGIATAAGVPRSTAAGWLRRDLQSVVTVAVLDMSESDLRAEVVKLRRRVRTLSAVLGLLVAVLRVSDRRAPRIDLSDRATRATLLCAAKRARRVLPASAVLKILGISSSRYSAWGPSGAGLRVGRCADVSKVHAHSTHAGRGAGHSGALKSRIMLCGTPRSPHSFPYPRRCARLLRNLLKEWVRMLRRARFQ
jgi:hypothetical protein